MLLTPPTQPGAGGDTTAVEDQVWEVGRGLNPGLWSKTEAFPVPLADFLTKLSAKTHPSRHLKPQPPSECGRTGPSQPGRQSFPIERLRWPRVLGSEIRLCTQTLRKHQDLGRFRAQGRC